MGPEDDPRRIAGEAVPVDPDLERLPGCRAKAADADLGEAQPPDPEELPERIVELGGRFLVDDPRGVVYVQRRDELVLDVDSDQRRHGDVLAVDVDVQVAVVVHLQCLLGKRGDAEDGEAGAQMLVLRRPGRLAELDPGELRHVADQVLADDAALPELLLPPVEIIAMTTARMTTPLAADP